MAKGDTYYLVDCDGRIVAKFEQDKEYMSGACYECTSWVENGSTGNYDTPCDWSFVARVYCKYDACTHWYFCGEDYDAETNEELDGYYHLCGAYFFTRHIRHMCFIWKLAPMIISEDPYFKEHMAYIDEGYFDSDEIKNLVETMLKGYTIKRGTV
jgi:hypothetical protein